MRPLPERITSSMNAEEIRREPKRRAAEPAVIPTSRLELSTTVEEMHDEVRVWLADGVRLSSEVPLGEAFGLASQAALLRDAAARDGRDHGFLPTSDH